MAYLRNTSNPIWMSILSASAALAAYYLQAPLAPSYHFQSYDKNSTEKMRWIMNGYI